MSAFGPHYVKSCSFAINERGVLKMLSWITYTMHRFPDGSVSWNCRIYGEYWLTDNRGKSKDMELTGENIRFCG